VSALLDAVSTSTSSALRYQISYVGLSLASAALGFSLVELWRRHPPPQIYIEAQSSKHSPRSTVGWGDGDALEPS
jgi:hypothetical protein